MPKLSSHIIVWFKVRHCKAIHILFVGLFWELSTEWQLSACRTYKLRMTKWTAKAKNIQLLHILKQAQIK